MTNSTTECMGAVQRGVEYLDAVQPNWRAMVDPENLDMSDDCCCMLGQVFGDYGVYKYNNGLSLDWSIEHGFQVDVPGTSEPGEAYSELRECWREVLEHAVAE